jgi:protein-histidine pros-kinase
MKNLFPNTIFARLFALALAALVLSNIITAALFFSLHQGGPLPSAFSPWNHRTEPPPPPPEPFYDDGDRHGDPFHPQPAPPPNGARGFWIALSVQFLAFVAAAWLGARTIARPIQYLAQGAAQLGENIDNPPLRECGPAETRAAARVFNDMQQRIRQQLEERARFLAAVSHDLRTPLTRMRLRATQFGESFTAQKFTDDINEMAAMLDATLQYLRGEAQTEQWQMLDVQALVESIAEDALDSGYTVPISGSAKPALLMPIMLRRCISNLVANALQYAGNAEIKLHDSPSQLVIEIIDQGPGIPENKIPLMFEPFVRLDESRNKSTGGFGLGLAIARDTVRRHGGELTLHNMAGGGLLARIKLPRRPQ